MKVIAHTGHTVLVEASVGELAQIMGLSSDYNLRRNNYDTEPRQLLPVGKEIPVHDLWKIIEHERHRADSIERTAKGLDAVAAMLRTINASLPTPPEAEKKEAAS